MLEKLDLPGDPRFRDSLTLISAVSGGSLGAAAYVAKIDDNACNRGKASNPFDTAAGRAETPALDQVAWGLVQT